ncbi:GNAT family N-acetyltransferase [Nonomuraea sp. NPDC046570]|uniref:GNAT family N-acetyltransferase n=1 Tax=Nonomuraea sp. NPDC046570 TaxID=3155255 RepID=UPI0033FCA9B5
MFFRSTVEADLDALLACAVDEPISWAEPRRLRDYLAGGQYRHDRIWVAEHDGRILARAVWWGFAGTGKPLALDCVWVHESVDDRVALAADLLKAAHEAFGDRPEYHIFLPNGWRELPEVAAALAWRREAAERAGLTGELERLRYEWTPRAGVAEPTGRLVFHPEPDDQVFLDVFAQVAEGSLDVDTVRSLASSSAEEQARETLETYTAMKGERDWWRLARTAEGELVGFALPSANDGGPVVGYLGVVPGQRGRGYVGELLDEITRFLAARGAQRIAADTDTTNLPMAGAFERAGYRNFAVRLVLSPENPF